MIEEPKKLTIKKPSRRPDAQQIAAFQSVPTGFIVDAMAGCGALSPDIRPLGEGRDLLCVAAGPALTVDTGPADVLALLAAQQFIQPGDIVVSAFSAYRGCAACGDRVAGMMRNNKAAGFVTDGPMRDYAGVVAAGLPVWSCGINPNSPVAQGPGRIGLPIQIGGRQVESGDMVIADHDGVVIVPYAQISQVLARLERISTLEAELDQAVLDGLKIMPAMTELLASDAVAYVE